MNSAVDQDARDLAVRAIAMISAHEQVCIQRAINSEGWRQGVNKKLDDVNESIKSIYNRNWVAACSAIVLLLGVIGYLLDKHGM